MPELITKATPEQTPNSSVIKETTAFFNRSKIPPPVRLTQYDNLPFIAVRLVEGDEDYTVPSGAAVNIRMKKPDGTIVYNPAFGLSADRHTVYIETTTQMTVCPGCVSPILEVVVNSEQAGTAYLHFEIESNPVQEDDIESTDEGKTITQLVQAAQSAADAAAASEEAAADSAKDAQGAKTDAETAAEQANTAKTEAQTAAEQANTAKTEAQTAAGQANTSKTEAQTAATNAKNSADAAADSAQQAAIESQKALGFRSYFGGQVVPDSDGDLDPSRPMSTPTAASVTIKARGDRIAGLTMAGKTTQEGTGDPSPDNIRMISGVGAYDQCVVLDGSNDETWTVSAKGGSGPNAYYAQYSFPSSYPAPPFDANTEGNHTASSHIPGAATGAYVFQGNTGICCFTASGNARLNLSFGGIPSTVSALRTYLSQHPLTVWYKSVDYAKSTGPFYTVVELSQDPYRAVGFELNAPLFDGDSLKIGGKSGFDQMVVVDGSKLSTYSGGTNSFYYDLPNVVSGVSPTTQNSKSNWALYVGNNKGEPALLDKQYTVQTPLSVGSTRRLVLKLVNCDDVEAAKAYLASHPLTVFYKSVDYTEEADIPVALEKHTGNYLIFDGTETVVTATSGPNAPYLQIEGVADDHNASHRLVSSVAPFVYAYSGAGAFTDYGKIIFGRAWCQSNGFANAETMDEDFKSFLTAQYSAGAPVQVLYELATPVTYARPVPTMIAQPGEDGTFTVTGENSLSVLLKAFQDGGDAATLNGKKWQVFKIDVPASAWTGSGTNYAAAITLSGMTAALNVVACALGSSYVGTDAAEQAMAQWDYLETGANTVIFHAAVKPTADFGVVLTTSS